MAAVNGKHRDDAMTAGHYGKHSRAHADLPVAEVLHAAVARGDALRLAWPADEVDRVVEPREEFPTGVLPVVRGAARTGDDGDTEPLQPAMDDDRRQLDSFSWWPTALAV